MAKCLATEFKNNDVNNAAFYYSVNMLRMLRSFDLLSEDEYKRILKISAKHYKPREIYGCARVTPCTHKNNGFWRKRNTFIVRNAKMSGMWPEFSQADDSWKRLLDVLGKFSRRSELQKQTLTRKRDLFSILLHDIKTIIPSNIHCRNSKTSTRNNA